MFATGGFPEREILAIRADGTGDVTRTHVAWRTKKGVTYVPSPLYHAGRLYVVNDTGVATCFNARTGREVWSERLGGAFTSSLVLVGDLIYATNEAGKTYVFKAGDKFEQVAANDLGRGGPGHPGHGRRADLPADRRPPVLHRPVAAGCPRRTRGYNGRMDPPPPPWLASGQVPSLNGLRAAAVGVVLLAHFGEPYAPSLLARRMSPLGWVGVDLFFAVSGFLITTLLLRERDRTGRVSLPAFYARRALRLLPAYYAYLLVIALVLPGRLTGRDWIGVLTYTQNFTPGLGSWPVSHFWSLSLEEHFYLVWPVAVVALGPRWAARLAGAVVILSPALRAAAFRLLPADPTTGHPAAYLTWCRADTLAAGCLLAFAARAPAGRRFLARLDRRPAVWAVLALAVVGGAWFALPTLPGPALPFYFTAQAVGLTAVVWLAVARSRSAAGRVLNARPVAWVGLLSYSLYVWQQPFSDPAGRAWWQGVPTGLGLAVGCAVLSRYLVERPFLRVKDRLGRARHG